MPVPINENVPPTTRTNTLFLFLPGHLPHQPSLIQNDSAASGMSSRSLRQEVEAISSIQRKSPSGYGSSVGRCQYTHPLIYHESPQNISLWLSCSVSISYGFQCSAAARQPVPHS